MCSEHNQHMDSHDLYHEKQSRELCALHALNNLLQVKDAFKKKDLDDICLRLSPGSFINPHKSVLGLGNYDVNVVISALNIKEFETIWFDKRKNLKCLKLDNVFGFILNVPADICLGPVSLPLKRKHWVAIRKLSGDYYNFDSKLNKPKVIGDDEDLYRFFTEHLESGNSELLVIIDKDMDKENIWKIDVENPNSIKPNSQQVCDMD